MLSLSLCLALLENSEDSGAYTAFFDRYHRLALQKAKSFVNTHEAAEDVAQEVMLYAAMHFDQFQNKSEHTVISYLLFCTRSRAVDYLRKQEKFDCVELDENAADLLAIDTSEQIVLTAETAQRALCHAATLPQRYRMALKLHMGNASYDEIAALLNISKETAYKRVQRAYAMIRERMVAEDGE